MESRTVQLKDLVQEAKRLGAVGAQALCEVSQGVRVDVLKGKTTSQSRLNESELTVKVWLEGGREGVASGDPAEGRALVGRALSMANTAPKNEHAGPHRRLAGLQQGLGIADRRISALDDADRLDVAVTAERSARATDRRIVSRGFWYQDQHRLRSFANSRGVVLEEFDTTFRAGGAVAFAGDECGVTDEIASRSFSTVASLPFGILAARMALTRQNRGEKLAGEVRVLFSPAATAALFARISQGFTQDGLATGGMFLIPTPEGQTVVDRRLHLVDDGLEVSGLRSRSFDPNGVLPVPLTLLREGRVEGRFLGIQAARQQDQLPTGHRQGDTLAPSNLRLRSGTRSSNAILKDVGGYTFVVDQLPSLGGLDMSTGLLEVPVFGRVLKAEKQVGTMGGMVLHGDLKVALNRVIEVASNTDRVGHVDAPAMLLEGLALR
ncbi:MAG: hypothetical protein GWP91_22805 [Rhodobacterales bacterium]|nr:hypothetical protein [Rhodobacterales bacterium]